MNSILNENITIESMKFIEIINEMNFNEINKKLNNYQIVTLRKII